MRRCELRWNDGSRKENIESSPYSFLDAPTQGKCPLSFAE
jgi:hypothetical protein